MHSNEQIARSFDELSYGMLGSIADDATRIEAIEALTRLKTAVMARLTETVDRQAFIDRAASAVAAGHLASRTGKPGQLTVAEYAYDVAEALWSERARRTGGTDG